MLKNKLAIKSLGGMRLKTLLNILSTELSTEYVGNLKKAL